MGDNKSVRLGSYTFSFKDIKCTKANGALSSLRRLAFTLEKKDLGPQFLQCLGNAPFVNQVERTAKGIRKPALLRKTNVVLFCWKRILVVPARKIVTTNNKRCPACYTEPKEQSECQVKMINCTGKDETYCAEVFLQKKEGGKNTTTTMKGCANKAFCEKMDISATASSFTLLPNSNYVLGYQNPEFLELFLDFTLLEEPGEDHVFLTGVLGQLFRASLPLPIHCCQDATGQLHIANMLRGQLAVGGRRESQAGGSALNKAPVSSHEDFTDLLPSHPICYRRPEKTRKESICRPIFVVDAAGLSLECEECLGLRDCSGNMVTCDIGKDRCSVTGMVLPMGLSLNIKTCVSSDVCDKGVQVINMGQQGKAVAHLKCCEGDECRNVASPDILPLEISLKGCANKALCDSLVGYEAMAPENNGDHAMRCTPNSSIYLQEFTTVGQWNDLIKIEEFSGGVNTIPRWFGLFITILSGILLRKLLA
ncbi:hypothetical protein L345_11182, partial [Ophiophagus hannah]